MSWIRSLVLVVGLSLLAVPASLAEGDEAQTAAAPAAEAAAPAAEEAAPAAEAAAVPAVEAEESAAPSEAEPQPAAKAAESAPSSAAAAPGEGPVARAVFTTAVVDREPSDELSVVSTSTDRVYFFTELRGVEGKRVTHRWEQAGEVRAEVSFDIGGPRWRVWSSKQMLPEWTGEWRVTVVDESGAELAMRSFSRQAPE